MDESKDYYISLAKNRVDSHIINKNYPKVEIMTYTTNYESLYFYYIGGLWGYAVMVIVDENGERKIRLSKCKKQKEFPETAKFEWMEIDTSEISNLSQVNHINFKSKEEMDACFSKLQIEFKKI